MQSARAGDMATNVSEEKKVIYLSINQGEQAKHQSAEYLLAAPVFEEIARLLDESLRNLRKARADDDLDDLRAHETILLDGGRGTGKTTILVNLSLYMESVDALKNRLLILKPVDPTLLENDDDLFLNIIVAAILRDKTVKTYLDVNHKDNQKPNPAKIEKFYKQLQSLGHALEGTQKQKSEFGIEKLRAFVGNHSVAEEVHKLFAAVLDLTGKEMIVLPIDDVDTSLENAFKNLEVVRRYLASPYIVPIISGDQELFHEVIWRNFYHGLTANCNELKVDAIERAKRLAIEYERKLIPVGRKLRTPDLDTYFRGDTYYLKSEEELISFVDYKKWLSFLNNFHLNGFEKSRVEIQVSSLRAFVQLVRATKEEVVDFDKYLTGLLGDGGDKGIHLLSKISKWHDKNFRELIYKSIIQLEEVYRSGKYGSEISIVYRANKYWLENFNVKGMELKNDFSSLFETPLFQPLSADNQEFLIGENGAILKESWKTHLHDRIEDATWLENLPERTVVSFPNPDKGLAFELLPDDDNIGFSIRHLMVQDQLYVKNQGAVLVFLGRIFELLTLSILPNINRLNFYEIFERSPFYSVTSFSGTKPINLIDRDFSERKNTNVITGGSVFKVNNYNFSRSSGFSDLVDSLMMWRNCYFFKIDVPKNALLIYRVMNKFFTQLSFAHDDLLKMGTFNQNSKKTFLGTNNLALIGLRAFNAYCAALGSFERPDTQGLRNANGFTVPYTFEESDLFHGNVEFFLKSDGDEWTVNEDIDGITGALYLHPLRSFFEACIG